MYMSKKKFDEIKAVYEVGQFTLAADELKVSWWMLMWARLWLLSRTCWRLRRTQSKTASRTQLHLSDA